MRQYITCFIIVMACLFSGHSDASNTIYKIKTKLRGYNFFNVKNLNDGFGIKGVASGGKIEVRVYYEPEYYQGGRKDKSFIYGFYIDENNASDYSKKIWVLTSNKDNAPWYCTFLNLWFCGDEDYSISSTAITKIAELFQIAYKSYPAIKGVTRSFKDMLPYLDVPVVVELELSSGLNIHDNFVAVNVPAFAHPLRKEDFQPLEVKGINFWVRPTATKEELQDSQEDYNVDAVNSFNITHNYETDPVGKLDYDIVIPRKVNPHAKPAPVRSGNKVYATNVAVYPLFDYDSRDLQYYFDVVSTNRELVSSIPGVSSVWQTKKLFKAKVENVERDYYLYRAYVNSLDRILVRNITDLGPFPATNPSSNIQIKVNEPTELNVKMHDKSALPHKRKFLVAWHRGFWKGYPENTIESIAAADGYDLLELDVSKTSDFSSSGVPNYVLFHDPFMFRESSIGPSDPCVDPYDKILVPSTLLAAAQRQNLLNELKTRFPGYSDPTYNNWIKPCSDFTFSQLTSTKVRDRFGCLTDITIPSLTAAFDKAKDFNLAVMIDKGWDDIDGIYWTAIEHNWENNVYFKGGDNRPANKLANQYGDELMQQIGYTPFYFDNKAQQAKAIDANGDIIFLKEFLSKEIQAGWNIPGFELQIKMYASDGSGNGFSPDGINRLLDFTKKYKPYKWIGITQINPTAYNGFDNKIIYMNAGPDPTTSNPYSSRFDRRADLNFNYNYLESDYWTSDRPDVIINFLKTIGKIDR